MHCICLQYSLAELIRRGRTTVVELGPCAPELVELVPASGNRVYIGQSFRTGKLQIRDGWRGRESEALPEQDH